MMQRMAHCYNENCKYNNDGVCAARKRSFAWRVRQPRMVGYIDLARHPDVVPKMRDRNAEAEYCEYR